MNNDRELLELAAKAAGLPVEFDCEVNNWFALGRLDDGDVDKWWNPLEDDGDALRLAVKLGMVVEVHLFRMEPHTRVGVSRARYDESVIEAVEEDHGDKSDDATRRAIVRAAASIGRA